MIALYKITAFIMKLSSIACILLMLAFLLSLLPTEFKFEYKNSLLFLPQILAFDEQVLNILRKIIPTIISGKDFSVGIVVTVIFLTKELFIDNYRWKLKTKITRARLKDEMQHFETTVLSSADRKSLKKMEEKIDAVASAGSSRESREELLHLFDDTRKKLESMSKDVAFLSIDVVSSTKMKRGEAKPLIELTFKEYKVYVANIIAKYHALKSSWTPDGVMICFSTADDAVMAAKDVLEGMPLFNRAKNSIKTPFQIRCGVNHGNVYYDADTPMEEMSDHVIDVAGHMQKYANPDSIYLSKECFEMLEKTAEGFAPIDITVDEFKVYCWEPQTGNPEQTENTDSVLLTNSN